MTKTIWLIIILFTGNRPLWEFGWAYGVGWGAAIFLFGGAILLMCDKESDEIYYKERKVVREDVATGMLAFNNNSMANAGNFSTTNSSSTAAMGNPAYHYHQQQLQQNHNHCYLSGSSIGMRNGTQLA